MLDSENVKYIKAKRIIGIWPQSLLFALKSRLQGVFCDDFVYNNDFRYTLNFAYRYEDIQKSVSELSLLISDLIKRGVELEDYPDSIYDKFKDTKMSRVERFNYNTIVYLFKDEKNKDLSEDNRWFIKRYFLLR